VGLPRSGSTWIARTLSTVPGAALVFEPDNQVMLPYAVRAKRPLHGGYYPVPAGRVRHYSALWSAAYGRGKALPGENPRRLVSGRLFRRAGERSVRAALARGGIAQPPLPQRLALRAAELIAPPTRPPRAEHVIVKSVYAARSIEWIARRLSPEPTVVVVVRPVRDTVASWQALGWIPDAGHDDELTVADPASLAALATEVGAPPLPEGASALVRTTWLLAVLLLCLDRAAARNPQWVVVSHPELCLDPAAGFADLASALGLPWTQASSEAVLATNRPGSGFETNRVPSEAVSSWRRRLSAAQIQQVESELERFAGVRFRTLPHPIWS
jgi:hypothetical protein